MTKRREANGATAGTCEPAEPVETRDRISTSDFFQQLQQLSPEAWQSGHKVYCYRTWPVIDKRDQEHFLCKVSEPFDEDYLLRHFGSGKYYLQLNGARGEKIASKTVSLHNTDFAPKVSPDEVVQTDPRNETYFKVWSPRASTSASAPPSAATADGTAVQELSKLMNKLLEQRASGPAVDATQATLTNSLVQWALDQTGKERENNDPTKLAALFRELKTLMPAQQPTDNLAVIEKLLAVVEKLNPPKREAEDPLSYVEKAVNLVDKLRPQAAPAPAAESRMGAWQEFFQPVLSELVTALSPLVPLLTQAALTRNGPRPPGFPSATASHPASGSPAAAGQPQDSATGPDANQQFAEIATNMAPQLFIALGQPGITGEDFAFSVTTLHGPMFYSQLAALDKEVILAFLQAHPLWQQLGPLQARVPQFIEEFIAYRESEDEEQSDEGAQAFPIVINEAVRETATGDY